MFDKLLLVLAVGLGQSTGSAPSPESPPPSPPSSPPSEPPFQCTDLTLQTQGWQMISFYCAGTYIEYRTLNDIMKGVPFEADDQILLRHHMDGLVFATFTGKRWVGSLVKRGISQHYGYKVLYKGPVDAVINQTGRPGTIGGYLAYPKLYKGWNYLGHGTCVKYTLNSDLIVTEGKFSIDDRFRTRSLRTLITANYDGSSFQGNLEELESGVGYEVFVAQDVTFKYNVNYVSDDWRCR